ncbi:hypothetical protein TRFO_18346 [Tritrichomonas foetus]|uniref:Uncharacterized protein n=1 Tax=Tritrichomonas foetus TaxID=1144522 RepID=A0A1J4KM04_9EUKA|nr:hypothetical protein TRFO_18346 [Tritrichomonas foetus]|eukprot:OHT11968.1 hypothetical protein TRFO_18346 [Tritrichomonas foetus]
MPSDFVCLNAMPGLGCNYPESLVLGILYLFSGLVCFFLLVRDCRQSKTENHASKSVTRQVIVYWIFTMIWLFYRGILWIYPFNYNHLTFRLFHGGLNQILFLIPIAMIILILCELLYSYYNPGKSGTFFRIIFVVFLIVFLVTGIALSFIDSDEDTGDPDDAVSPLYLWGGATNLITLVFVVIPAAKLIKAVSYPVTQPEDEGCVKCSIVGIVIFSIFQITRCIYNILQHFGANFITKWYNEELFQKGGHSIGLRSFNFVFYLLYDLVCIWIANIGVVTLYKHDMKFADDPFYARTPNDPIGFRSY